MRVTISEIGILVLGSFIVLMLILTIILLSFRFSKELSKIFRLENFRSGAFRAKPRYCSQRTLERISTARCVSNVLLTEDTIRHYSNRYDVILIKKSDENEHATSIDLTGSIDDILDQAYFDDSTVSYIHV